LLNLATFDIKPNKIVPYFDYFVKNLLSFKFINLHMVSCNNAARQKHIFSLSLSLHRAGPAAHSHYFDILVKITFESAAQREFLPSGATVSYQHCELVKDDGEIFKLLTNLGKYVLYFWGPFRARGPV